MLTPRLVFAPALLAALCLVISPAQAADDLARCEALLKGGFVPRVLPQSSYVDGYEATRVLSLSATKALADFDPATGLKVVARDRAGEPTEVVVRVLSDNAHNDIRVIGEFNNWNGDARPQDKLTPVPNSPYYEAHITGLKHGMQYRLVLNGRQVLDPAAYAYSSDRFLNSVFWDFGRPGGYAQHTAGVDLRDRHVVLGETEIRALVERWPNPNGGFGPANQADTYKFIATSGVIKQLKKMGYNAIEFLPFNMSNDGSAWHYRYQVYGLSAPDSKFGTPDDFAAMMDAFNDTGIGIVMDVVVGHYPFNGNGGNRDLSPVGLHNWKKADGRNLYGDNMSPWGTYRYDYANPYIRRHLIDSILTMVKRYGISGLRFDNLDGIRFAEGGRQFLYELHQELRAYRPELWTNAEMFFGDSSVTAALDRGGLGLNTRTNMELFDWFKQYGQGRTQDFNMAALRSALRTPIEWWREGSRVDYDTSHDEAANGRGGFTGQYIASLLGDGTPDWWILRKSEVFEALVLASGSATMDMPQARLLQKGNFSYNSAIDWGLLGNPGSAQANEFLARMSRYIDSNAAFNFRNMSPAIENHTDYDNKVISLMRTDGKKKIYIVINLNDRGFDNYRFGVDCNAGQLKLVLDNDDWAVGGTGELERRSGGHIPVWDWGSHQKPHTAEIPYLPPMSVTVFEQ